VGPAVTIGDFIVAANVVCHLCKDATLAPVISSTGGAVTITAPPNWARLDHASREEQLLFCSPGCKDGFVDAASDAIQKAADLESQILLGNLNAARAKVLGRRNERGPNGQ
jgi:hypothetical protein